METKDELQYHNSVLTIPIVAIFIIWFVYWLEIKFGLNFNKWGVYPRTFLGFRGVFTTHFIHSNTQHLFNNSVPLFVLLMGLYYFYNKVASKVLIYGALLTGLITWFIGRDSYHIGASGVVYLLFSFIFFSGVVKKHYRLIATSLVAIFLYGSMIWYIFPVKEGISWEGHLSGFFIGFIFAIVYRNQGITKEKYKFSKTDFDDMFDEHGNYIPPTFEEENIEENNIIEPTTSISYRYIYKEKDSEE